MAQKTEPIELVDEMRGGEMNGASPCAPLDDPHSDQSNNPDGDHSFELLMELVGTNGRWNYMVFGLCALATVAPPLQSLSYQFLGATPDYWCLVPELMQANWTQDQIISLAIPYDNETGVRASCEVYNYNYTLAAELGYDSSIRSPDQLMLSDQRTSTRPCPARYFNASYATTVTEWDLVCERRALYSTTFSAAFSVRWVSSFVQGIIIDTFGRRRNAVVASAFFIAFGLLAASATSLHIYLLLRVLISLFDNFFYVSCYALSLEVCSVKQRSVVGNVFAVPWAVGYMVLAGLAYVVRDWRWLQTVLTLPALPMLSFYWLLPESPRWLVTKGRVKEAAEVMKKAAAMNGRRLPPDNLLITTITDIHSKSSRRGGRETRRDSSDGSLEGGWWRRYLGRAWRGCRSLRGLVATPRLLLITTIVQVFWFSSSMIYYGVSLNSVNLSTDPYLYMFLGGLLEVPSYVLLCPLVAHCGRRRTNILLYLVCGVSLLLIPLLQATAPSAPTAVKVMLSLLGKLVVTSAFQLIYLYTGELYPTCHRSFALSLGNFFSAVGATVAPYVNDILVMEVWWAPPVLFGSLALTAAFLTLLLPETNLLDLPDTTHDLHAPRTPHHHLKDTTNNLHDLHGPGIKQQHLKNTLVEA